MNDRRRGPSGKAKKTFKKRRADRLYEHQLIDEYLAPEQDDERHIPIRHRGEFMPTAEYVQPVEFDQLELPLEAAQQPERPRATQPKRRNHASTGNLERRTLQDEFPMPPDIGVPSPLANNHYEMFEFAARKQAGRFSAKRFAYGCLLGGSVAAAILLTVRAFL